MFFDIKHRESISQTNQNKNEEIILNYPQLKILYSVFADIGDKFISEPKKNKKK